MNDWPRASDKIISRQAFVLQLGTATRLGP
jgi:hypothetical protein